MEELAKLVLEKCAGAPIVGILSCDLRGVIGYRGKIPWNILEELKFFRNVVRGSSLIMGRKTFESMPASVLEGKTNIVFSREPHKEILGTIFVTSIQEFQKLNLSTELWPCFMIGGAQITHLFLQANLISKFILSKIEGVYEGDAAIDLSKWSSGWQSEVIYQSELYTTEILSLCQPAP